MLEYRPKLGEWISERDAIFQGDPIAHLGQGIQSWCEVLPTIQFYFHSLCNKLYRTRPVNLTMSLLSILYSFTNLLANLILNSARYECALLQNRTSGVPVVPIFAAEIEGINQGALQYKQVDTKQQFPDVPHKRGDYVESVFEEMRYGI